MTSPTRDLVAEYIARRKAEAASAFNPLFPNGPTVAKDPPPAITGDPTTDYISRRNWIARRTRFWPDVRDPLRGHALR